MMNLNDTFDTLNKAIDELKVKEDSLINVIKKHYYPKLFNIIKMLDYLVEFDIIKDTTFTFSKVEIKLPSSKTLTGEIIFYDGLGRQLIIRVSNSNINMYYSNTHTDVKPTLFSEVELLRAFIDYFNTFENAFSDYLKNINMRTKQLITLSDKTINIFNNK